MITKYEAFVIAHQTAYSGGLGTLFSLIRSNTAVTADVTTLPGADGLINLQRLFRPKSKDTALDRAEGVNSTVINAEFDAAVRIYNQYETIAIKRLPSQMVSLVYDINHRDSQAIDGYATAELQNLANRVGAAQSKRIEDLIKTVLIHTTEYTNPFNTTVQPAANVIDTSITATSLWSVLTDEVANLALKVDKFQDMGSKKDYIILAHPKLMNKLSLEKGQEFRQEAPVFTLGIDGEKIDHGMIENSINGTPVLSVSHLNKFVKPGDVTKSLLYIIMHKQGLYSLIETENQVFTEIRGNLVWDWMRSIYYIHTVDSNRLALGFTNISEIGAVSALSTD